MANNKNKDDKLFIEDRILNIEKFLYKFFIERMEENNSVKQDKIIDECREILENFKCDELF